VKSADEIARIRAAARWRTRSSSTYASAGSWADRAGGGPRPRAGDARARSRRAVVSLDRGHRPERRCRTRQPGPTEIGPRQLVVVDLGCLLDGYCSDCTRTFSTGGVDGEALEVYELVERAQLEALGAIHAGRAAARSTGGSLHHRLGGGTASGSATAWGHGVGIEVHEGPRLSRLAPEDARLETGNVVTVEPGVYPAGEFGVRIEDLVDRHRRRLRDPEQLPEVAYDGRRLRLTKRRSCSRRRCCRCRRCRVRDVPATMSRWIVKVWFEPSLVAFDIAMTS